MQRRIVLAVALVAAPARCKVAVTMQATAGTTLTASETHIEPGTATCRSPTAARNG